MTKTLIHEQSSEPLVNYVRVHRRRAGLSQRELGRVLGYHNEGSVGRHEQFRSLPPLLVALGYEIVFQVSVAELFPGLKQTVAVVIERRMNELENEVQLKTASVRTAASQKKLEWLKRRKLMS